MDPWWKCRIKLQFQNPAWYTSCMVGGNTMLDHQAHITVHLNTKPFVRSQVSCITLLDTALYGPCTSNTLAFFFVLWPPTLLYFTDMPHLAHVLCMPGFLVSDWFSIVCSHLWFSICMRTLCHLPQCFIHVLRWAFSIYVQLYLTYSPLYLSSFRWSNIS